MWVLLKWFNSRYFSQFVNNDGLLKNRSLVVCNSLTSDFHIRVIKVNGRLTKHSVSLRRPQSQAEHPLSTTECISKDLSVSVPFKTTITLCSQNMSVRITPSCCIHNIVGWSFLWKFWVHDLWWDQKYWSPLIPVSYEYIILQLRSLVRGAALAQISKKWARKSVDLENLLCCLSFSTNKTELL